MFMQQFTDRDVGQADAQSLLNLIEPRIDPRETDFGVARLRFDDGEADLYGMDKLTSGFMVNHISGLSAWDFLVEVARAVDLTIMPVGGPTAVCRADLLAHLPDELREDAIVVASGAELLAALGFS